MGPERKLPSGSPIADSEEEGEKTSLTQKKGPRVEVEKAENKRGKPIGQKAGGHESPNLERKKWYTPISVLGTLST